MHKKKKKKIEVFTHQDTSGYVLIYLLDYLEILSDFFWKPLVNLNLVLEKCSRKDLALLPHYQFSTDPITKESDWISVSRHQQSMRAWSY